MEAFQCPYWPTGTLWGWWHWPSPEMKRRCWTPWRTESANVRLTKDLMFRWSTRDNQESYWDCRGSDGKVSGRKSKKNGMRWEIYGADSPTDVCLDSEKVKEKRWPRTIDTQVKGESGEVRMTELELKAQRERDKRRDAEMLGGQREGERCEHKRQRRQNVRQREKYRAAQTGRQVINHPKKTSICM